MTVRLGRARAVGRRLTSTGPRLGGCTVGGPLLRCRAMTKPTLDLRVTRLENDTEAIYELIADVRTTQDEHSRRLDGIDGRLDRIEDMLAEVVRRLPEAS